MYMERKKAEDSHWKGPFILWDVNGSMDILLGSSELQAFCLAFVKRYYAPILPDSRNTTKDRSNIKNQQEAQKL